MIGGFYNAIFSVAVMLQTPSMSLKTLGSQAHHIPTQDDPQTDFFCRAIVKDPLFSTSSLGSGQKETTFADSQLCRFATLGVVEFESMVLVPQ